MKKEKINAENLTEEQKKVLFEKATEPAFSGKYYKHDKKGTYKCAACGHELFTSEDKFESKSGWPSFTKPAKDESVEKEEDRSLGMKRTEVVCGNCGSHLGHVFNDGPKPTGQRYCINSLALDFSE